MPKTLVNNLKSDVKVNIVNGDDPWYKNYTDAMLDFTQSCNPQLIQAEKKNLSSISCFQYGFMDVYRRKIEETWRKYLMIKYKWQEAAEIMKEY